MTTVIRCPSCTFEDIMTFVDIEIIFLEISLSSCFVTQGEANSCKSDWLFFIQPDYLCTGIPIVAGTVVFNVRKHCLTNVLELKPNTT
jgi:hypothetical protein